MASGDVARADAAARYHVMRSPDEHDEVMRNHKSVLDKLMSMNWREGEGGIIGKKSKASR